MEIEKTINYDKAYRDLANLHMEDEHFRHILSDALRAQQEREKGCFWCKSGAFDESRVKVNFCPVCGRRLKEAQGNGRA